LYAIISNEKSLFSRYPEAATLNLQFIALHVSRFRIEAAAMQWHVNIAGVRMNARGVFQRPKLPSPERPWRPRSKRMRVRRLGAVIDREGI
jgi:hypothetical protein